MAFWIAATALTLIAVVLMIAALRRGPETDASPDMDVYRDQLREVERDRERGTLAPEEAEAARTEVARRLLAADKATARPMSNGGGWIGMGLVIVVTAAVAGGTYWLIGAPGYADLPLAARIERIEAARAARPGQAVAEAEVPDRIDDSRPDITTMADQLRTVLADRPDDLRGWQLGVQTWSGLNDLETAWRAQDRVVAILGDDATGGDFAMLAELMILAAGGYVSPEAEQALAEALRRDPANGWARYYAGVMYAQGGRPDVAWPIWKRLVSESRPGDPWLEPIYARTEAISSAAGDPTPVSALPTPRGPSAADLEAAENLSPEERMDMIEGMVGGLATRLADQGGPPGEWARLITAYGVLGRSDAAATVYAEARLVFADDPTALDTLARAADQAGIAP
ncbi:MAG: c-type cytochrome biogenesis protein CcmI [Pseudomonadota bacterium]